VKNDVELYMELTRKYLIASRHETDAEVDKLLDQLDDLYHSLSPEDQQRVNDRLLAGAEVLHHRTFDLTED